MGPTTTLLLCALASALDASSGAFPGRVPAFAPLRSARAGTCGEHTSAGCGACVMSTVGGGNGKSFDDSCVWCSTLARCIAPGGKTPAGCGPAKCVRSPDGGESSNCTSTAGWPGVVCPGFVPPPPPPPVSPKIWDSAACSCKDYCNYKCSNAVEHANTGLQNVTLYRLTPYQAPGIDSMNTADPGGDVDFVLSRKDIAVECQQHPGGERCFLAHANLYGKFTVEVDGKWGPYQFCNPTNTPSGPNVSHFECCNSFDHDAPGTCLPNGKAALESSFTPYPRTCDCARGNVSVGKVDHGEMEKWAGWSHSNPWSLTLGGLWYSTPRGGKCEPGQRPGTGQRGECTWRTVAAVYKNTSCVDAQLDKAVEAHGKTCFATCPPKSNPAFYKCYVNCYFSSVGGDPDAPGGKLAPMTKQELTGPWVHAIESEDEADGGCPKCKGRPPFHAGGCAWTPPPTAAGAAHV